MIEDIVEGVNRLALILSVAFMVPGCGDSNPSGDTEEGGSGRAGVVGVPLAAPRNGYTAPASEKAPQGRASTPEVTAKPQLIFFSRDNCLPCEIMAPWVTEIATMYQGRLEVEDANLDREAMQPLGLKWRIRSVPTQLYLDEEGAEVFRHEGLATREEMSGVLCSKQLVTCL